MFLSRAIRTHYPSLRRLCSVALPAYQQGYTELPHAPHFGGAIGDSCLRDSTAAVARRLTQQTQFPLLPGTPFTVEGALSTNPFKRPRLILTPGPDSVVTRANAEWESFFGFAEDELRGQDGYHILTVTVMVPFPILMHVF